MCFIQILVFLVEVSFDNDCNRILIVMYCVFACIFIFCIYLPVCLYYCIYLLTNQSVYFLCILVVIIYLHFLIPLWNISFFLQVECLKGSGNINFEDVKLENERVVQQGESDEMDTSSSDEELYDDLWALPIEEGGVWVLCSCALWFKSHEIHYQWHASLCAVLVTSLCRGQPFEVYS